MKASYFFSVTSYMALGMFPNFTGVQHSATITIKTKASALHSWCEHCLTEYKASGSQNSQILLFIHSLVCLPFIKKKIQLGRQHWLPKIHFTWLGKRLKGTYKRALGACASKPSINERRGPRTQLFFFQACITQQEDTQVHPRTLELFIRQVGRRWEAFNKNLIFEILTHYHLHNWVRQWKYTCMSLGKTGGRSSWRWTQNCAQARWGLGRGAPGTVSKEKIFKAAQCA